jgi:hypothetical protein
MTKKKQTQTPRPEKTADPVSFDSKIDRLLTALAVALIFLTLVAPQKTPILVVAVSAFSFLLLVRPIWNLWPKTWQSVLAEVVLAALLAIYGYWSWPPVPIHLVSTDPGGYDPKTHEAVVNVKWMNDGPDTLWSPEMNSAGVPGNDLNSDADVAATLAAVRKHFAEATASSDSFAPIGHDEVGVFSVDSPPLSDAQAASFKANQYVIVFVVAIELKDGWGMVRKKEFCGIYNVTSLIHPCPS